MGLERVKLVGQALSLDFTHKRVITVAGTNGKGTTCRFIEAALLKKNKSVGVYSSPHLIDYRERVRINGELKSEAVYVEAFEKVELARGQVSLTYFEFGTLAAMLMMQQQNVEYVILEVGLGGRLDATNIIDPDIAVITSIGLDHQDWLGDTREKIALEKAGIIRSDSLAVIGEPEPPHTLTEHVEKLGCKAWWAGHDFSYEQDEQSWRWQCEAVQLADLTHSSFLHQNVSSALTVLKLLDMLPDASSVNHLLETASLPGRRQLIATHPDTYLDVGHNPQASVAMKRWLQGLQAAKIHYVVGMLKDKSVAETLSPLAALSGEWYCASLPGARGNPAQALYSALPVEAQQSAICFDNVTQAFNAAKEKAEPNDIILVFGSFLTVADVLVLQS